MSRRKRSQDASEPSESVHREMGVFILLSSRAAPPRRTPPCPPRLGAARSSDAGYLLRPSPSPAHAPSVANLVPGRAPNMQRSFGQPLPLHPSWEPAKPIYPIQSAGTRDHPAVGRDLALGGARHGRAPRQGRSSVEHAQRGGRHAIVLNPPTTTRTNAVPLDLNHVGSVEELWSNLWSR